jgi:hypothetical protein
VALGRDPEERPEQGRELVLVELARLESPQQSERLRVLAEDLLDALPVEALCVTEGAKAFPDVGREDAAVVDEEPLQLTQSNLPFAPATQRTDPPLTCSAPATG